MIDLESVVFTKVKYFASKKYPSATFTTATPLNAPPSFPCVVIKQLDDSVNDTNLECQELSVLSSIQIEIYTNGTSGLSVNRGLADSINDAMSEMCYRRAYGFSVVENPTDPTIIKRVARYQRVIADNDSI